MKPLLGYSIVSVVVAGLAAFVIVGAHGGEPAAQPAGHADGSARHAVHQGPNAAGEHGGDSQAPSGEQPTLGVAIQGFSLSDSTGKAHRVGMPEGGGQITVLTFWCAMCGSCRMIDADFDEKARAYGERGVRYLAVDSTHGGTAEPVNQFLERSELGFPVLLDPASEIALAFGARFTTTTAVIDDRARLRYYGGYEGAEAAVQDLLAGVDVAVPETPGFGCAILLDPESGMHGMPGEGGHDHGGHRGGEGHGPHGHSHRRHGGH